jgi:hypothetical protein
MKIRNLLLSQLRKEKVAATTASGVMINGQKMATMLTWINARAAIRNSGIEQCKYSGMTLKKMFFF